MIMSTPNKPFLRFQWHLVCR